MDGKALMGIAACGHVVSIDAEVNAKGKVAMARKGLDVVTVDTETARTRFCDDIPKHFAECQKAKK